MKSYKMILSYDGTNYQGWQEQPEDKVKAIANVLKQKFKKNFNHDVSILGASRTDAGVHALGQVARILTNFELEAHKLQFIWNNSLPEDILIRSIACCDNNFHPLKNVKQKTYYYHFFQERPLPFNARYGWHFLRKVDLKKLQKCLEIFVGKHDFRSFSTGYEMQSTIRTIDDIKLEHSNEIGGFRVIIKGKSFLHHMIRRIVGACLDVASRPNLEPEHLVEIMSQKNPNQALPNADPKGLLLYSIEYDN